jgi:pyruvate/2-oxoglutarate dehydrogenase complex dihydrolipoamide dehydrogenase (E3) component
MSYDYDMVVIGGGAAGLTAAGMSAVLGARTALVEAQKLGGDCTWHGCVPSKTLLHAAKIAHRMRTADRYGLTPAAPAHDFARVMEHVRSIRQHIYDEADAPPHFEKLGVEVVAGRAAFLDAHTLAIHGAGAQPARLTSRKFIVATGSAPRTPRVAGIESVEVLNNESVFELTRLPGRLLVMGAGPIGIEMAQAFRRLGSEVTVVDHAGGILGRDDPELTAILLDSLRAEGIRFLLGDEVTRVEPGAAYTKTGQRVEADAILAAVGRSPTLDGLNLSAAGVRVNERGIVVDRRCRSSARHIYACGDVAGRHLFTHMAEHMAKVAVMNAILHVPFSLDERHVTWCTFTDPELAHVGSSEAELQRDGVKYTIYRFPFTQLDRAITESETTGLVKVLAGRWGRILGVSILGAHAGEMIGEYALAMRNGVRLDKISSTIHPYPTYGLGNRRAADLFMIDKLSPGLVRWLQRLFRLRGGAGGIAALRRTEGPG